ncbi:glutaredoxin family protein [Blastopirellula marina]|uniref:Glutaredoxin family protein n=1 Tax=Blastopirellula marina TaxID=124 RepID=A0A2S8G3U3_9BACT|nr:MULTISPECIES: glutaredoxin family protein [Pirellulaceae]PQO39118.1 glutaredoxin family protein [Blastopirellula marina]RCS55426.1 glutaredoxin family protein [Bremerella cremea]
MSDVSPPQYDAQVVLYTRQGCHCCENAEAVVRKFVSDITRVDIDSDPELLQKFNTLVPVVEINGKVRFRGKVSPMLLERTLAAEARQAAGPAS